MVVIAIMALVASVAPFAFNRLQASVEYRDTVRAVLTDMRSARYLARSSGKQTRFVMDLEGRSFGLEGGKIRSVPKELVMRAIAAAQETDSQNRYLAISFLPQGGATGGSLDLIRPSGSGVRLRVDWFSGRVEQEAIEP